MGADHQGNDMRLRKRRWVYEGLGLPPGVMAASARPFVRRRMPGQLLLVGDEVAQSIAPPLTRLCRDARVAILAQAKPASTPEQWCEQGWLIDALGRTVPDLLLLGFMATAGVEEVERLARMASCPTLWISPLTPAELAPHGELVAHPVHLPDSPDTMVPTAAGYAAWAGEVWKTMEHHG